VVLEHLYFFNSPFFELVSPQQLLVLLIPELNLERCVAMVPEALPYNADPISQIRLPETPSHLHEHAKLHVLRLHVPSLEAAKKVRWRISDRQPGIFAILDEAPWVKGLVAMVPPVR
jgi:hypothetical protein